MCKHGNMKSIAVNIPEKNDIIEMVEVDSCIAPIVEALQSAKIWTSESCCGHGQKRGIICLYDGRILEIITKVR